MQEVAAAHKALLAAVAIDQSVQVPFELLLVSELFASGARRRNLVLNLRHAIGRQRMGHRPVRHAARVAVRLIEPLQRRQETLHARWIPAGFCDVADAELIGFELGFAAMPKKHQAESDAGQALKRLRLRKQDAADREASAGQDLLRIRGRRMARVNMANLVPQHRGHLGFVSQERQDAAREIDESARSANAFTAC